MKASLYAIIAVIVIALIAGGAYVALHHQPTTQTTSSTTSTPTPTTSSTIAQTITPTSTPSTASASATSKVDSFTVTGKEYSFSPNKLTVSKGDTVKITFTNSGTMSHNLTIPDYSISTKTIEPGQSDTIQFTADKTGTFDFYCSIGSHRQLGMAGTLLVQ